LFPADYFASFELMSFPSPLKDFAKMFGHKVLGLPNEYHRHLIGVKGKNILRLEKMFSVRIKVLTGKNAVNVRGFPEGIAVLERHLECTYGGQKQPERTNKKAAAPKQPVVEKAVAPKKPVVEKYLPLGNHIHPKLIGKGGENVRRIAKELNLYIRVLKGKNSVKVNGTKEGVDAFEKIIEELSEKKEEEGIKSAVILEEKEEEGFKSAVIVQQGPDILEEKEQEGTTSAEVEENERSRTLYYATLYVQWGNEIKPFIITTEDIDDVNYITKTGMLPDYAHDALVNYVNVNLNADANNMARVVEEKEEEGIKSAVIIQQDPEILEEKEEEEKEEEEEEEEMNESEINADSICWASVIPSWNNDLSDKRPRQLDEINVPSEQTVSDLSGDQGGCSHKTRFLTRFFAAAGFITTILAILFFIFFFFIILPYESGIRECQNRAQLERKQHVENVRQFYEVSKRLISQGLFSEVNLHKMPQAPVSLSCMPSLMAKY